MESHLLTILQQGRERYAAGDYTTAEQHLAQVARDPEGRRFADLHNMLGVIYHAQARFKEAQEAFEEALRINPSYTEAALNLSVTYNDLGKYQKAKEVYSRALATSGTVAHTGLPHGPADLESFAKGKIANMHADVAEAYLACGLPAEAIHELDRALALCPQFVDLRIRLANACRDAGDLDRAVSELEAAKQAHPTSVPALVNLGIALYKQGRRTQALAEFCAAEVLAPGDKRIGVYIRMASAKDD
jgi:tetratricopeptide (TPR) repeat protein